MSADPLTFEQVVPAAQEAVYTAFTNVFAATQWLCDHCQLDAREEGRLYLYWNEGYWTSGAFTAVDAPHHLRFSWHGRGEPAPTAVDIRLLAKDGGTAVTLVHSGVGDGDHDWGSSRDEITAGWQRALANLTSIFDSGLDKRVYDRPMMGVAPVSLLSEADAAAAGVPGGIRISDTIPNTSAAAAGLQADDILVRIDDIDLAQFGDLGRALADKALGDELDLTYLRDGKKERLTLTMGGRPAFPVPDTIEAFGDAVNDLYTTITNEIETALAGVDDATAARRPSPEEWSAKEVLIHMLVTELDAQTNWVQAMHDRYPASLPGDTPTVKAALLDVYPTTDDLLALWRRTVAQTVALIRHMPDTVRQRPVTYQNWGTTWLFGLPFHTRSHVRQMKEALAGEKEAV